MAEPEMVMVSSSNVEAVGYDPDSRELWVRFTSGSTYVYSEVDERTHEELMNASSIGSYLNRAIKGNFDYRKE
jgi:KTSC domain